MLETASEIGPTGSIEFVFGRRASQRSERSNGRELINAGLRQTARKQRTLATLGAPKSCFETAMAFTRTEQFSDGLSRK